MFLLDFLLETTKMVCHNYCTIICLCNQFFLHINFITTLKMCLNKASAVSSALTLVNYRNTFVSCCLYMYRMTVAFSCNTIATNVISYIV